MNWHTSMNNVTKKNGKEKKKEKKRGKEINLKKEIPSYLLHAHSTTLHCLCIHFLSFEEKRKDFAFASDQLSNKKAHCLPFTFYFCFRLSARQVTLPVLNSLTMASILMDLFNNITWFDENDQLRTESLVNQHLSFSLVFFFLFTRFSKTGYYRTSPLLRHRFDP